MRTEIQLRKIDAAAKNDVRIVADTGTDRRINTVTVKIWDGAAEKFHEAQVSLSELASATDALKAT